jgi:hypothetical protein
MNTLYYVIALFALGAIIGMYLLALVLQKKETPKFVAFIHGAFVGIALILLIFYSTQYAPELSEVIILLIIAAFGGVILIIRDLTGKPLPAWLAVSHGVVAILGFLLLLIYVFA